MSSYNPDDVAAGNLPSDTGSYNSMIPEGIMKPKDFDTEGHDTQGGDYSNSTPSPYTSDLGSNQAAGVGVDDSESKIPQGIMAPKADDTFYESSQNQMEPSITDEGKDALPGALDYAEKPVDDSSREPMFKSANDYGNKGNDTAQDTGSDYPDVSGSVGEAAYQAKDNVQEKAAGLNNATDDSETYTQKAANTAYAVKDKAADTLGLNQPSEGPSVVDQTKDYSGSASDTTKDQAYQAKDAAAEYTGAAAEDYAGSAADTTQDTLGSASDTTRDTTGEKI